MWTPCNRSNGRSSVKKSFMVSRRGPGTYSWSSLKQMTTTEAFDAMDASVRQCQFDQTWVQCNAAKHRQEVFSNFFWLDEFFWESAPKVQNLGINLALNLFLNLSDYSERDHCWGEKKVKTRRSRLVVATQPV